MERLGIVDDLQASTAALIESARRRGMSAAAIALLPRVAPERPRPLPPVVLAGRSESNPGAQATMKAFRARTKRERAARVRNNRSFSPVPGRSEITSDDRALYDSIVALVSAASNVPADHIRDFIRPRRVVPARHLCWYLMREFSGLGTPSLARITGRLSPSTITEGIARAIRGHLTYPAWAAVYWEVRTRLSAAGHRIVEDLGGKRGCKP